MLRDDPQPVAVRILRQLVAEAERAGIVEIPIHVLRAAIDNYAIYDNGLKR